jgi:hypothetical protein
MLMRQKYERQKRMHTTRPQSLLEQKDHVSRLTLSEEFFTKSISKRVEHFEEDLID